MAQQSENSVCVASIQCGTPNLNRTENIKLLQPLIEKAAKQNASFVLLPEFATGS